MEENLTKSILQLFKAVRMIQILTDGKEINKENLNSDTIKNYRGLKIEAVQEHFKTIKVDLIAEEEEVNLYQYLPKKKKANTKEPKKSTVQETYELWQQKMTIEEISKIRVLTPQTIQGHLAKLIEAKTISITDVLSQTKIEELSAAFDGYNEDTLHALKEEVGDQFTWGELRIFKASLNH